MILWLLAVGVVVQCGYALYFFVRPLKGGKSGERVLESAPVSVIICARNEANNLKKNLPKILSQRYDGKFEVIVVNDGSTDDTAQVLQQMEQQYDNLWDVPLPADGERVLKGKKHALAAGVAHAANEWLLLTDADCAPASDEWLGAMVAPLGERKEIVLGYGGYNKAPGLLNAFIRWETMHTWLQYSRYAQAGMPYMGVGRNMACTKSTLLAAQQSELWNVLPSGDDDMLVRIMGNADNVAVVGDVRAHTYSDAKATWGHWAQQKQRHLSTGKYYSRRIKLLLGGYAVSHVLVWISIALMVIAHVTKTAPVNPPYDDDGNLLVSVVALLLLLLATRGLQWCIWAVAAVRLRQKSLIRWLPLMDIGWLFYNFAFLPYITWKNKQKWT